MRTVALLALVGVVSSEVFFQDNFETDPFESGRWVESSWYVSMPACIDFLPYTRDRCYACLTIQVYSKAWMECRKKDSGEGENFEFSRGLWPASENRGGLRTPTDAKLRFYLLSSLPLGA